MPKENTHLWFARGLLDDFPGKPMLKDISGNIWSYLLGSVSPDTFYYGAGSRLPRIAEAFHGKDGNPTNTTIIHVLDEARDARDMAFILGFITHCALDITFHPVIYYLSGNYYDADQGKRRQAVYMHRHLETCMDRDLNSTIRFHRIIRTGHLRGLVYEDYVSRTFHVNIPDIRGSLRRQIAFNLLFTSVLAYRVASVAIRFGIMDDPSWLGLFYADALHGERLPDTIRAADLMDGRERITSVKELLLQARALAVPMMEAAYAYGKRELPLDGLLEAIPGLSLDTGRLGVSASSIRHTRAPEAP